jgi:hypothetical protein
MLRPNHATADKDRFLVCSGRAVVGVLTRNQSGAKAGAWHWSITGFHVSPADLGPGAGMAATREEAMTQFATCWRTWPSWAGLKEIEPGEHVTLP